MAGGTERILRGRIKAMQSTKKITRAMELIAGSRIVKAQQRVQAAVPYSEQITEVVKDLAAAGASSDAPILAGRDEVKTTCYVAITADRGLCGGYNAGVQSATEGEVKADDVTGRFIFEKEAGFTFLCITATGLDPNGNSSSLSDRECISPTRPPTPTPIRTQIPTPTLASRK